MAPKRKSVPSRSTVSQMTAGEMVAVPLPEGFEMDVPLKAEFPAIQGLVAPRPKAWRSLKDRIKRPLPSVPAPYAQEDEVPVKVEFMSLELEGGSLAPTHSKRPRLSGGDMINRLMSGTRIQSSAVKGESKRTEGRGQGPRVKVEGSTSGSSRGPLVQADYDEVPIKPEISEYRLVRPLVSSVTPAEPSIPPPSQTLVASAGLDDLDTLSVFAGPGLAIPAIPRLPVKAEGKPPRQTPSIPRSENEPRPRPPPVPLPTAKTKLQPSTCCPQHLHPQHFLARYSHFDEIDLAGDDFETYRWVKPFRGTTPRRLLCCPSEPKADDVSAVAITGECHPDCIPAHIYSFGGNLGDDTSQLGSYIGNFLRSLCPAARKLGRETLLFQTAVETAAEEDEAELSEKWGRCLHCALNDLSGCPCDGRRIDDTDVYPGSSRRTPWRLREAMKDLREYELQIIADWSRLRRLQQSCKGDSVEAEKLAKGIDSLEERCEAIRKRFPGIDELGTPPPETDLTHSGSSLYGNGGSWIPQATPEVTRPWDNFVDGELEPATLFLNIAPNYQP